MAPCCIVPENLRGAMIIGAPSMFPPAILGEQFFNEALGDAKQAD
jgi:hypothetical protein